MLRPRRASDVRSLFGATPEQVRQREMESQADFLAQMQSDPYQSAGAAIGLGLSRLFSGKSKQLQEAEATEGVLEEQRTKEAELMSAVEEEVTTQGSGTGPVAQPTAMSEALSQAEKYESVARRFQDAGTPTALQNAEKARELATKFRIEASQLQTAQEKAELEKRAKLASIAVDEARAKDLLKPDVESATFKDTNVLAPDGTLMRGTKKDGVLYIKNDAGEDVKAPDNYLLVSDAVDPRGQVTTSGLQASMFMVKNTDYYKQYSSFFGDDKEAQNALVSEFTRLRVDSRNANVPTNNLVRESHGRIKGTIREVTRNENGKQVTYIVDVSDPQAPVTLRRR